MGDRERAFAAIWGKATGGRAVAVDPHLEDAGDVFTVAPAPGVREACDWLSQGLVSAAEQRIVFLVGGPGGGKSHALTQMTAQLVEERAKDTGLAQRKYHFRAGSRLLTVVNDASIRGGHDRHPLADDVDQAIRDGAGFLGCVNRGILVEEAHALATDTAGARLIKWLAGVGEEMSGLPVVADGGSKVLEVARLEVGESNIDVVAVYVDHCSLFEVRPHVDPDLRAEPYKVKRLKRRSTEDIPGMPAGALLSTVIEHLSGSPSTGPSDVDPVQANVESLESASVQAGVLTLLRAAEAVAGSRMTFREVWGAILRALTGDLPQYRESSDLETLFPPLSSTLTDLERFQEMRSRARLRMSEAIFGVGLPSEVRVTDPVLRMTAPVDPVLDAVPGRLAAGGYGWASPVLDAFSGLITSVSPLATLLDSLDEDDPFREAVTDFDRSLDLAFLDVTQPQGLDDVNRRDIVAWYGDYLSRLYALSNGVSAFRQEVAAWLDTRSALPSGLERELKTLLRPARVPSDPHSGYLLPLFSSRTVPISGSSPEPQLVLKGEVDVQLRLHARGDSVSVEMSEGGTAVGEIELDFALVRTALACANQRLGVTEQAARVGPRVERFRAKRLIPARITESEFRLVTGQDLTDVYVES